MRKWNSKQKSKNTISQCIHSHEHHRGKDNPPYCCVLGQWPGKTVVNDGLHTCPLAFYVLHSFSVKYFQSSFLVTCSFWLCTFQWFTKPIMLQSVWGNMEIRRVGLGIWHERKGELGFEGKSSGASVVWNKFPSSCIAAQMSSPLSSNNRFKLICKIGAIKTFGKRIPDCFNW